MRGGRGLLSIRRQGASESALGAIPVTRHLPEALAMWQGVTFGFRATPKVPRP